MVTGALVNAAAILAGGMIGLLLKGGISENLSKSLMKVIGLCIMVIGISGALHGDLMLLVVSLAAGTVAGEFTAIDNKLNRFGMWVQTRLQGNDKNSTFAEGFAGASLLFCVGAMAIVGSINSGMNNDLSIIFTKSILDGISAMVLASSLGVGVLFSAAAVFIYQGTIELFSGFLQHAFTTELIVQISAAGGVMILGIGINMVFDNVKIKVANSLPGLVFAWLYYLLVL